jgi:YYY domain-containing protein
VAGCELVFLRDYFGPGFQRMNTVFKFYYQVWILLGLAAAYGTLRVWEILGARPLPASARGEGSPSPARLERGPGGEAVRPLARGIFALVLVVLCASALVYPLVAGYARADRFQRRPTLDGIAYWEQVLPGDLPAIRWLQQQVTGAPVILEALPPDRAAYSEFNRVSAFTGLPTVIGWGQHERLWRGQPLYDEIARRQQDVEQAYRTPQPQEAEAILQKYNVQLVYVGPLERQTYGAGVEKFAQFMDPVFQSESATVYRRRG